MSVTSAAVQQSSVEHVHTQPPLDVDVDGDGDGDGDAGGLDGLAAAGDGDVAPPPGAGDVDGMGAGDCDAVAVAAVPGLPLLAVGVADGATPVVTSKLMSKARPALLTDDWCTCESPRYQHAHGAVPVQWRVHGTTPWL